MLIKKSSVYRHLIIPLRKKGFNITLIGSIAKKCYSNKDIDLLLCLPKYPQSEKTFESFEKFLCNDLFWEYNLTDEYNQYGIFHNYQKNGIGLDIFINEKI